MDPSRLEHESNIGSTTSHATGPLDGLFFKEDMQTMDIWQPILSFLHFASHIDPYRGLVSKITIGTKGIAGSLWSQIINGRKLASFSN